MIKIKPPIPLVHIVVVLLITGCIFQGKKHDEWQPVDNEKTSIVHTVQSSKENLSIIAKWYTGKAENRKSLADANPNISPDSLSAGNKIFIPSNLLKTKTPMPKKFVKMYYKKPKKKKIPAKPKKSLDKKIPEKEKPEAVPKNTDEFDVIGPK